MSKEMNEQLLRLREKVLQAEQERLEGAETFSVAEARKCLNGRNDEEFRNLVLEGLEQIKQGKTKDFNIECDRYMSSIQKMLGYKSEIDEKQMRDMVLESYRGIEAGEGRDCAEFFDELEKELKELKKRQDGEKQCDIMPE